MKKYKIQNRSPKISHACEPLSKNTLFHNSICFSYKNALFLLQLKWEESHGCVCSHIHGQPQL